MKHVPGIVVGGPLTVGGITLLVGLALSQPPDTFNVAAFDRARLLKAANQYLSEAPKPDVMYDAEWPMRHSSLLFAGLAFGNSDYVNLWKTLRADSTVEEVTRNFFIRQPVLWVN